MKSLTRRLVVTWTGLGPRFLPFADAATPDLPLSRLLRLSLFQVSVGMALVLLVGTLNRVMIVELGVPASLVAVMVSLPVLYAPVRALIGTAPTTTAPHSAGGACPTSGWAPWCSSAASRSCPSRCWCCPAAAMPRSGRPGSARLGAAIAFLLVGAGVHTVQTAGLALATDLAAARVAAQGGRPDVRDAAGGHHGQRRGVRPVAGRLQPRPPGSGDPGCGGGHAGAQCHRPVEAGDAPPAAGAQPARHASFGEPGPLHRRPRRCAGWWPSAWAPWPSACRTCCSSPTAARSSA
jgi:hypothetical protein